MSRKRVHVVIGGPPSPPGGTGKCKPGRRPGLRVHTIRRRLRTGQHDSVRETGGPPRGGTIAWGIVPTDPDALAGETVKSLRQRMDGLLGKVEALGFSRERILRQSLITPARGLGTRPPAAAARALELARDLAEDLGKVI